MHRPLALAILFISICASSDAHDRRDVFHRHVRRQQSQSSSSSSSSASTVSASAPPAGSGAVSAPVVSSSGAVPVSSASATPTGPPPLATFTGVPPLANISVGMPTRAGGVATTTYQQGATPTYAGAPGLPTPFIVNVAEWPTQDKVPDTSSPQVQEWMKELDGFNIPSFNPTADGSCLGDPAAAADSANRGWWTCGGHTRSTDIVACPDKNTWGVSFDDGPSVYTPYLLEYLTQKNIQATFFVVGSRAISKSDILIEEYMAGHEISVHTWSHRPLTSLTTEQVVAELGWTRKAIKDILGITPTTMRPPFGDIDDRVRAISLAMGMVPVIWTRSPQGVPFDTNDWRVAGGIVNATDSVATFQGILNNASILDSGFIVLQHDLYEITVDLAVGTTLDLALAHQPPLTLQPIGQCVKIPTNNLYLESNKNTSFPYPHGSNGQQKDTDGDGSVDTNAKSSSGNGAITSASPAVVTALLAGVATIVTLLL